MDIQISDEKITDKDGNEFIREDVEIILNALNTAVVLCEATIADEQDYTDEHKADTRILVKELCLALYRKY